MTHSRSLAVVYFVLPIAGAACVGVWVLHHVGRLEGEWIEVWAPHAAAIAVELFIASVVVAGLLRRHETKELRPLRMTAVSRLQLILASFLRNIAVQYAFIGPDGSQLPDSRAELLAKWLDLLRGTRQAWLRQWLRELDRFGIALETFRDRYSHVLDPMTVSLVDAYLHQWREDAGLRLRASYELAKTLPQVFAVSEPDTKAMTPQQIAHLETIVVHAVALCDRYEEIAGAQLVVSDERTREQFRLTQAARRAARQVGASPGVDEAD